MQTNEMNRRERGRRALSVMRKAQKQRVAQALLVYQRQGLLPKERLQRRQIGRASCRERV